MTSLRSYLLVVQILHTATLINMAPEGRIAEALTASRHLFAGNIFQVLAQTHTQENVVFSPASIQSCLALAFLGAEGETAQQLRKGLHLPDHLDKSGIAADYANFLQKNFHRNASAAEDAPTLRMANRVYVDESLQLSTRFNELAKTSFESEAVPTRFADSSSAVKAINTWVANETAGKITDLLQPDAVNDATSAILVNAIYFKAKWLNPFSEYSTSHGEFRMSNGETSMVPLMYGDERVKYGEWADLDCKAIELPYKNSDLVMTILLPNKVEGLAALEQKLAASDLNTIADRMSSKSVDIFLPKFRIEYEVDLKEPLQKLGLVNMFSESADFSGLFVASPKTQKVDDVKHKAYLDVNEAGSEAAAATFMKIVPMSLNLDQKIFKADHPFVFAIRNREAVFFIGHVARL